MKPSAKLSTGFAGRSRRVWRSPLGGMLLMLCGVCMASPVAADQDGASRPASRSAEAAALLAGAEAGDRWAQLNLGAAFDHGMGGFPLDPVRAVLWYRRAAEAGLAEAQFNLAHCLVTGNGTARDDVEALGWMLRAAEQGLASAQFLAGVMLAEGLGAPADREQAMLWLQRGADNGNLDAAAMLARMQAAPDSGPAVPARQD